jgi:hypothetical protein
MRSSAMMTTESADSRRMTSAARAGVPLGAGIAHKRLHRSVDRPVFPCPPADAKTAPGIVAEPLDFTSGPEQLSSRKYRRSQNGNRNSAGEQKRSHHMARTSTPAPHAARSAADTATTPDPARCPGGGRQPRSGRPGRAVGRTRRRGRRGDRCPRRDQHASRQAVGLLRRPDRRSARDRLRLPVAR